MSGWRLRGRSVRWVGRIGWVIVVGLSRAIGTLVSIMFDVLAIAWYLQEMMKLDFSGQLQKLGLSPKDDPTVPTASTAEATEATNVADVDKGGEAKAKSPAAAIAADPKPASVTADTAAKAATAKSKGDGSHGSAAKGKTTAAAPAAVPKPAMPAVPAKPAKPALFIGSVARL